VVNRDLVPAFVKLLKDTEAEVRSAIAGQIPGEHTAGYNFGVKLTFNRLLLAPRARDPSPRSHAQHRRVGVGSVTTRSRCARNPDQWAGPDSRQGGVCNPQCAITCPLTSPRTISHLLPMFLQMLKDEFPDVRLNIISKLESVNNGTFHPALIASWLLTPNSDWNRATFPVPPPCHCPTRRGQAMACSIGHYRIRPSPCVAAWRKVL
jgi:hypothetical protein